MTDVLLDPQGQQQHSAQPPEVISGVTSAARDPAGPDCAGNMDVTNKTAAAAAAEPVDAFVLFEVLLALLLGTLHGVAGARGSAAVWLAVAAALAACLVAASIHPGSGCCCGPAAAAPALGSGGSITLLMQQLHWHPSNTNASTSSSQLLLNPPQAPQRQQQQHDQPQRQQHGFIWSWSFACSRPAAAWAYSLFLCLIAAAFLAFPVPRPWSGPPEPFVRWHPYSTAAELVWRGVFGCYAAMMLWAGLEDPLGKHFVFVCYLGLSGCVHASVMLGMNLRQRAVGGPNGNAQHLYGDVAGWYAIGIASIIAAAAACRSQRLVRL
uniref:Uncharacterized protein n=1 Tax=Tetradesmus obliquus TaxID=3088 RepID=A0A383W017_TETOB|eukprot:jgi/Sobl393_1/18083/SZX71038.1